MKTGSCRVPGPPALSTTTSPDAPFSSIDEQCDQNGSHGTLMLSKGGRAKYLGPTAGSEWLKDVGTIFSKPSKKLSVSSRKFKTLLKHLSSLGLHPRRRTALHSQQILPKSAVAQSHSHSMRRRLESGLAISWRNYLHEMKHGSWWNRTTDIAPGSKLSTPLQRIASLQVLSHDVAPKTMFEPIFERVFTLTGGRVPSSPVNPQEIGLVFIVLAQGTMFNIEMPSCDPSVEEWLHLSERALVKGDFLSTNMLAGVQTVVSTRMHLPIITHNLTTDSTSWPIFTCRSINVSYEPQSKL